MFHPIKPPVTSCSPVGVNRHFFPLLHHEKSINFLKKHHQRSGSGSGKREHESAQTASQSVKENSTCESSHEKSFHLDKFIIDLLGFQGPLVIMVYEIFPKLLL